MYRAAAQVYGRLRRAPRVTAIDEMHCANEEQRIMKPISTALLVGVLLSLTSPASAEETHHPGSDPAGAESPVAGPNVQPGMGMMSGGTMPMMGGMSAMMAPEHIEGRIAFLKAELRIAPAQEPAWEAFAAALRSDAQTMQGMAEEMQGMMASGMKQPPVSVLDRLDRHERMLNAHREHLQRIRTALKPLYDSLDDDQRRRADELILPVTMGMM